MLVQKVSHVAKLVDMGVSENCETEHLATQKRAFHPHKKTPGGFSVLLGKLRFSASTTARHARKAPFHQNTVRAPSRALDTRAALNSYQALFVAPLSLPTHSAERGLLDHGR